MDELTKFKNYNRVVIFAYPRNAGGKFLINSLGLSSKFAMQSREIINQQIANGIGQFDKYQLLCSRLTQVGITWNDLGLGQIVDDTFSIALKSAPQQIVDIPDILSQLMHHKFYIPLVIHTARGLEVIQEFLPNAIIIQFVNTQPFISWRTLKSLKEYWDLVRGPSWPVSPPATADDLTQLPFFILRELRDTFKNEIMQYYNDHPVELAMSGVVRDNAIKWDCNKYLSHHQCLPSIGELYKQLDLDSWNPKIISSYYTSWIAVLEKIKNRSLNNKLPV